MLYLRKLSNNPNYEKIKNADEIGDLAADILKQELATTNNCLSFWKCENIDDIDDTIKAILLSTTAIKCSRLFALSDEIINKYGFKMDDTEPGLTGYSGFENLHINMIELTYSKVGTVLNMLREAFQDPNSITKIDKAKVKIYIDEVIKSGRLNKEALNDDLLQDIEKNFFATTE